MPEYQVIPAIRVRQWLPHWDEFTFDFGGDGVARPPKSFLMFSMPGALLRSISSVYERHRDSTSSPASGMQRRHNPDRTREISRFLRDGFPFADLPKSEQEKADNLPLRKPGWLPTAVVVNFLKHADSRNGLNVAAEFEIKVEDKGGQAFVRVPKLTREHDWEALGLLPPVEIIDGQHRLFAFNDSVELSEFDIPVVAFEGLQETWQAYLFWVINIKPKKINSSLAFDLYPLLRASDWLNHSEALKVYRETRAQEIVETLWSSPASPWRDRIDMLGNFGRKRVSQNAWVNALTATFIKSFAGKGVRAGGLFGSKVGSANAVIPWSRAQQAAFIISIWRRLFDSITERRPHWIVAYNNESDVALEQALRGSDTLLNQDQGVRAYLLAVNDIFVKLADELELSTWTTPFDDEESDESKNDAEKIERVIGSMPKGVISGIDDVAGALSEFDWRSANAPGLSANEIDLRSAYRGSGGYRVLRRKLLERIAEVGTVTASAAQAMLGDNA